MMATPTTTHRPSSSSIQKLNHEGLMLVQEGAFAKAVEKFRQALTIVHYGLQVDTSCCSCAASPALGQNTAASSEGKSCPAGCTSCSCRPTSSSNCFMYPRYRWVEVPDEETPTSNDNNNGDLSVALSPHNCFEIHNVVFGVPGGGPPNVTTTAVILQNFAFALLRQGLQAGRTRELEHALALYDECVALCLVHEQETQTPRLPTLVLAAAANALFLRGHLCRPQVQGSLRILETTLDMAVATPQLDEADLVFFLNCLVLAEKYQNRGAPAA